MGAQSGLEDRATDEGSPILIVPYMWIGDFVRGYSAVTLLRARWPGRPVDMLATPLTAPLTEFMPGVRRAVVADLPRSRLGLKKQWALASRLRAEGYGTVLVLPRTWKSALAPFLAAIPERVGFFGEGRWPLLNRVRFGERALPRMIDRIGALALPQGAALPPEWPLPRLAVPAEDVAAWRAREAPAADGRPVVALCPGAVGPGKRWPVENFAALARDLATDGAAIWVLGSVVETPFAQAIAKAGGAAVHDLTGKDLRYAVLALAAADVVVANDSGLLHIGAAIGTPSVGIFGPTDPRLGAPLNPLASTLEPEPPPAGAGRSTAEISVGRVRDAVRAALRDAERRRPA